MELSLPILLLLVGVAFISGIVSSVTASPALIMMPSMLLAGIPTHFVLGTQKLFNTISTFTSTLYFLRHNMLKVHFWFTSLFAAMIGSSIGVLLSHVVSSDLLQKMLPIFIIYLALHLLFHKQIQRVLNRYKFTSLRRGGIVSSLMGGALGIYSGLIGPGTGPFWSLVMTSLFKIDLKEANAQACFFTFTTNITALIIFMLYNQVHYGLGLTISLGGLLGASLGARWVKQQSGRFIEFALLVVTFSMAVSLFWKNWL